MSFVFSDPEFDPKAAKKMEKELKKMEKEGKEGDKEGKKDGKGKISFKGAASAVKLASKLSPKSQRRKDKLNSNVAQLKVSNIFH